MSMQFNLEYYLSSDLFRLITDYLEVNDLTLIITLNKYIKNRIKDRLIKDLTKKHGKFVADTFVLTHYCLETPKLTFDEYKPMINQYVNNPTTLTRILLAAISVCNLMLIQTLKIYYSKQMISIIHSRSPSLSDIGCGIKNPIAVKMVHYLNNVCACKLTYKAWGFVAKSGNELIKDYLFQINISPSGFILQDMIKYRRFDMVKLLMEKHPNLYIQAESAFDTIMPGKENIEMLEWILEQDTFLTFGHFEMYIYKIINKPNGDLRDDALTKIPYIVKILEKCKARESSRYGWNKHLINHDYKNMTNPQILEYLHKKEG